MLPLQKAGGTTSFSHAEGRGGGGEDITFYWGGGGAQNVLDHDFPIL